MDNYIDAVSVPNVPLGTASRCGGITDAAVVISAKFRPISPIRLPVSTFSQTKTGSPHFLHARLSGVSGTDGNSGLTKAVSYINSGRMVKALSAAIQRLFQRREYIDRINVFPVPDGDTGTNMAFSFKVVHDAVGNARDLSVKQLMKRVADASLDGSRGNSGAIMAQYFQGFSEALEEGKDISAAALAEASCAGAKAAWTAMSEPVAGTLPTVLEDFSNALRDKQRQGVEDVREMFEYGLLRARESLARTPEQLPVLKQAGVVDAGGQGFVDLLEGIWHFIEHGDAAVADRHFEALPPPVGAAFELTAHSHLYCTECVRKHWTAVHWSWPAVTSGCGCMCMSTIRARSTWSAGNTAICISRKPTTCIVNTA